MVVTNKSLVGKTILDWRRWISPEGVFLKKLTRAGQTMPFSPRPVERGDVMTLVGASSDVGRAAKNLGYADRKTVMTDMIFVGLGIVLGGLFGLLTLVVAGLPLTLTASGGALIMGLVFGWLRAVYPTFGRIPGSAMWIFDTVGLTVFMACVGLAAGPSFFSGLQKSGISLVFVGLVIAILPHTVAILFGRYVLKMNPVSSWALVPARERSLPRFGPFRKKRRAISRPSAIPSLMPLAISCLRPGAPSSSP